MSGGGANAGVLAIWNNCAPGAEAQYEHWYRSEHLAERVAIEGFVIADVPGNCVAVSDTSDVVIRDLDVSGCGGGAVELHTTARVTVEGCTVHDTTWTAGPAPSTSTNASTATWSAAIGFGRATTTTPETRKGTA